MPPASPGGFYPPEGSPGAPSPSPSHRGPQLSCLLAVSPGQSRRAGEVRAPWGRGGRSGLPQNQPMLCILLSVCCAGRPPLGASRHQLVPCPGSSVGTCRAHSDRARSCPHATRLSPGVLAAVPMAPGQLSTQTPSLARAQPHSGHPTEGFGSLAASLSPALCSPAASPLMAP